MRASEIRCCLPGNETTCLLEAKGGEMKQSPLAYRLILILEMPAVQG